MAIKYDDWKYANSRLADTYIMDDGVVTWVKSVDGAGKATLKPCKPDNAGEMYKKHCNLLDLTPIKLGYVNVSKGCIYTSRAPVRRDYRQGLSGNTIRISSLQNFVLENFKYHWLNTPASNAYPKFSASLDAVSSGKRVGQAFSRDFCLVKQGDHVAVEYRGRYSIGMVVNGAITLHDDFSYLKERISRYVD